MSFWCHHCDQNNNEKNLRISTLASKKRLNKGTLFFLVRQVFKNYLNRDFFDFTSFQKNFIGILVKKRHQKNISKLTVLYILANLILLISNLQSETPKVSYLATPASFTGRIFIYGGSPVSTISITPIIEHRFGNIAKQYKFPDLARFEKPF